MSTPFIAQVSMNATTYAPKDWTNCDGQLLSVDQHTAVYALLGTNYGGDGRSTFGIPDFRGRAPVSFGNYVGAYGVEVFPLGMIRGVEEVTINETTMPNHNHIVYAQPDGSGSAGFPPVPPKTFVFSSDKGDNNMIYSDDTSGLVDMNPAIVNPSGGGQPHNNMQPSIVMRFIIALDGIFPPRS